MVSPLGSPYRFLAVLAAPTTAQIPAPWVLHATLLPDAPQSRELLAITGPVMLPPFSASAAMPP
ncbi:MAG: hypothetical protein HYV63_10955 [Candidatus Schekmanbacteria bacterium]|nr:hypothetical protein [Candidatus Schekmanbacteria bacterium]